MDYVSFTCPEGYVFEDSNNITHYAFCYNTTFVLEYDPSKRCVRKYKQNIQKQNQKLMRNNIFI